jgi:hypothetical protein
MAVAMAAAAAASSKLCKKEFFGRQFLLRDSGERGRCRRLDVLEEILFN